MNVNGKKWDVTAAEQLAAISVLLLVWYICQGYSIILKFKCYF